MACSNAFMVAHSSLVDPHYRVPVVPITEQAAETASRRGPAPSRSDLTMEAYNARLGWVEREIGEPPHELRGAAGSGIWQALHKLGEQVQALADEIREMRRAADQRAAAAAPYSRIAWLALGAAITTLVAGGVGTMVVWISGLHH
jgi:hypothetical protein